MKTPEKPLREHFEVDTDAGTTLRTFDYIESLENYIATSQIEELTKEVERLKKEQEHYIQFTNEEIEKFREAYRKECVKNSDLKSSNDRYREALEKIANPIKWLQKKAESDGAQLNVPFAIELAKSASYLQEIAKTAIHESK